MTEEVRETGPKPHDSFATTGRFVTYNDRITGTGCRPEYPETRRG